MSLSQAILATLAYHDIFNYPLTPEEIHRYLNKEATVSSIKRNLQGLHSAKKIGAHRGYYFLKTSPSIVPTRIRRSHFSQGKLKRARFYARLLKAIPVIKLIAVSGALAMANSHKKDDIDLVIVTSKNMLWTTRFLANLLLYPFKRQPGSKDVSNRACLNIFIDEKDFKIKNQNLYTAHEICQLKPLWDKGKTYSKLVEANRWIQGYIPNWQPAEVQSRGAKSKFQISNFKFRIVENLLKNFQLWYMRSKVSTERIGETQLFFHPQDTQAQVLKEYQKRLKSLHISAR